MATLVGTQKNIIKLLNELIELDFDAVEAYQVAIDKLDVAADQAQLTAFMEDHRRHIRELQQFVVGMGDKPATAADVKAVLTKGKVFLGGIFGDRAILLAMRTNEDDTNTAYERAAKRDDLPGAVRDAVLRNLADERRHRAYLQQRLDTFRAVSAHR